MRDDVKKLKQLMDAGAIESALTQMALHISQMSENPKSLLIMGMATRGIPLAKRLAQKLEDHYHIPIQIGSLDATFYRDDFHFRKKMANPEMRITEVPSNVDDAEIVLVDDVLFTGRSVRAAMEALMDMGRARAIRLAVLVDRGHRELPICPDYCGVVEKTDANQEVRVSVQGVDGEDSVWLVEVGGNQ